MPANYDEFYFIDPQDMVFRRETIWNACTEFGNAHGSSHALQDVQEK